LNTLIQDAKAFEHIPAHKLIRRFSIKNKGKTRQVNDPIPPLKDTLKQWNSGITHHYTKLLHQQGVSDVAHAYLPHKSIKTNASQHTHSDVIQFDFKGFYDSCKFSYFESALKALDPEINDNNKYLIKRLLIDPNTGGVTQGLPVSGALAGISLIPFWVELKQLLPNNILFTQYSDDLTFSYRGVNRPKAFTIKTLTSYIKQALNNTSLNFRINDDKTRQQSRQYRKVTGIRINHHNQLTPARNDYRFLRHALYILSKSDDLNEELRVWGFNSKEAFVGKVSYMRSIDQTKKIDKLIMSYRDVCYKHNIFTTWIETQYQHNAFA